MVHCIECIRFESYLRSGPTNTTAFALTQRVWKRSSDDLSVKLGVNRTDWIKKELNIAGISRLSSAIIVQPDQHVLSTYLLFKLDVSLPLATGELLQKTIAITSATYKLYNIKI